MIQSSDLSLVIVKLVISALLTAEKQKYKTVFGTFTTKRKNKLFIFFYTCRTTLFNVTFFYARLSLRSVVVADLRPQQTSCKTNFASNLHETERTFMNMQGKIISALV